MTHLIAIGNSQGIRIPKAIIEQAGLQNVDLELKVVPEGLLVLPAHTTRQGWAKACESMHKASNDKLFLNEKMKNQFDQEEWEW